jgi:multiple sugar transport system substrate-binding protein
MVWSVASSFIQTQGTQQGAFFARETMEPLVKNEALARTLDIFAASTNYGPPNELQLSLPEVRELFVAGRCALTLDWGDIGTLAIDPQQSQVIDKVGAVILPGSNRVLDRASGKLVDCDKTTCPYAIEGVNHAPYAAFGGWSGAVNAQVDPRKKAAGYAFLSYMSQPAQSNVDVTIGVSGFNPYRTSQFTNREAWLQAGMSNEAASKYLGAIGVSLSSPNVVLDLRIPQNQRYQEVVLDATLADFLAGSIDKEEAMQRLYDGWEQVTEEVGRDVQRDAYLATLGIANQ